MQCCVTIKKRRKRALLHLQLIKSLLCCALTFNSSFIRPFRVWNSLTNNYGNVMPVDWKTSYTRSLHLPALKLKDQEVPHSHTLFYLVIHFLQIAANDTSQMQENWHLLDLIKEINFSHLPCYNPRLIVLQFLFDSKCDKKRAKTRRKKTDTKLNLPN